MFVTTVFSTCSNGFFQFYPALPYLPDSDCCKNCCKTLLKVSLTMAILVVISSSYLHIFVIISPKYLYIFSVSSFWLYHQTVFDVFLASVSLHLSHIISIFVVFIIHCSTLLSLIRIFIQFSYNFHTNLIQFTFCPLKYLLMYPQYKNEKVDSNLVPLYSNLVI